MDHPASPPLIATHPPGQPQELERQVVLSLARLATLQGCPMTYREFESLAQGLDDDALRGVPLASRIGALWQSRFPLAGVRAPAWPPEPGDLPALWLGPRQADVPLPVLIVLGALTNGTLSSLDDRGSPVMLRPELACQGRLLVLESGMRPAHGLPPAAGGNESPGPWQREPVAPSPAGGRLQNWIRRWWRGHR